MNKTKDVSLLEIPVNPCEKLFLLTYVFISSVLCLCQICKKNRLIWKFYPEFCIFMTFSPLHHLLYLFFITFKALILGDDVETAIQRIVPFLIAAYPIIFLPPASFALTLTYALFLCFKVKQNQWFLNFKVTRCKITIIIVSLFCMLFKARLQNEEKNLVLTVPLARNLEIDIDLFKYLPVIFSTFFVSRKLYQSRKVKGNTRIEPSDYAHIIHIALFLSVFWLISLTHLTISIYRYRHNLSPYPGRLLGVQDACIMQYVFVYSSYLLNWEPFKAKVCVSNIVQVIN